MTGDARKCKVLIVDDSATVRELLGDMLRSDSGIQVVGSAANGREAIEQVARLRPDIVTTDISMPVMDGLEAIGHIMAQHPVPILVISDIKDSTVAFAALSQGALEVLPKTDIQPEKSGQLIRKVKLLSKIKVIRHIRNTDSINQTVITAKRQVFDSSDFEKVIVIASSTGGPKALSVALSKVPIDYPFPVLVAQHIENSFVPSLIDWIDKVSPLRVKLGEELDRIEAGTIYISPGDRNMIVAPGGFVRFAAKVPGELIHPSCDKLLSTAADVFGSRCIGVILTGMGDDGAVGMRRIKAAGGATIAQDEATSIVFGMPNEAIKSGCVDTVLSIDDIGRYLRRLAYT